MSNRSDEFMVFASEVMEHIDVYTVRQFGDKPNDQVEAWTPEDCMKAIRKYYKRFGTGQRGQIEQERDMLKIAHYAALAWIKMREEPGKVASPTTSVEEGRTVWPVDERIKAQVESLLTQEHAIAVVAREYVTALNDLKQGMAILLGPRRDVAYDQAEAAQGSNLFKAKAQVDRIEELIARLEGKIG